MSATKVKTCKTLLKDIRNKYPDSEDYINERRDELCSHQKLSVTECLYF